MEHIRPGLAAFAVVWLGQTVSLLGSAMTWFALTIWAFQVTGQATTLAMLGFFSFGPTLLFSPLAGALVDRWNRKRVMMISDLTAGLATLAVLGLYVTNRLQVWHLYGVGFLAGWFQAFQYPAYAAAVALMVPREQYARASGMLEVAYAAPGVLAPLLAGVLLGSIGISGIMAVDVVTFVLALGTLAAVRVPQPQVSQEGWQGRGTLWQESLYGFRYIRRSGLWGLQGLFCMGNLVEYTGFALFTPMLLARTGNNELILGSVQSAGAVGGLVGGLALSIWGGSRRKIHGVLLGWTLSSLGMLAMGLGRNLPLWLAASFLFTFFEPIVNGSVQAIWQIKVPPDVQGRVFATQFFISQGTYPLAMLWAGPLADHGFEPALRPGGWLAPALGPLFGVGPGCGMAVLIALAGLLGMAIPLVGYAVRAVRDVESLLPDYDTRVPEGLG
ncbi:MAG: MFS transporter [Anaerolineae bacterium]